MANWDKWSEDGLICPYCGGIDEDAWEYGSMDDKEIECCDCGKTYLATTEYSATYYTSKTEDQT